MSKYLKSFIILVCCLSFCIACGVDNSDGRGDLKVFNYDSRDYTIELYDTEDNLVTSLEVAEDNYTNADNLKIGNYYIKIFDKDSDFTNQSKEFYIQDDNELVPSYVMIQYTGVIESQEME